MSVALDELANMPLFKDLSASDLLVVQDVVEKERVEAEQILQQPKQAPGKFYMVFAGQFEVLLIDDKGEHRINLLYPGEHFGYGVTLTTPSSPIKIRAITDGEVISMPTRAFQQLVQHRPAWQVLIIQQTYKIVARAERHFRGQRSNEVVILSSRRHWSCLLRPIAQLLGFALLMVGAIVASAIVSPEIVAPIQGATLGFLLLFYLIWLTRGSLRKKQQQAEGGAPPDWIGYLSRLTFWQLILSCALMVLLSVITLQELLLGLGLFLAGRLLIVLGWEVVVWWSEQLIITNERLIRLELLQGVHYKRYEVPISKIQNVNIVQSSLGRRILRYGSLTVDTAAKQTKQSGLSLDPIPDINMVGERILRELNQEEGFAAWRQRLLKRQALRRTLGLITAPKGERGAELSPAPPLSSVRWPVFIKRFFTYLQPATQEKEGSVITWRKHSLILFVTVFPPGVSCLVFLVMTLLALANAETPQALAHLLQTLGWFIGATHLTVATRDGSGWKRFIQPFGQALGIVISMASVSGLLIIFYDRIPPHQVALIQLSGWGAVALSFFWLWWCYDKWHNDVYILRPDTLMTEAQQPLRLGTEVRQIPLQTIEEVELIQPNPFMVWCQIGHIIVQTAGEEGKVQLRWLHNPHQVQSELASYIQAYHQQTRDVRLQAVINEEVIKIIGLYEEERASG